MTTKTLIEKWNTLADEEIDAFLNILRLVILTIPENMSYKNLNSVANVNIENIHKHKLFKMLMEDACFKRVYSYIDIVTIPKSKATPLNKIKILESIVFSYTLYARRKIQKTYLPDLGQLSSTAKIIHSKATELIKFINDEKLTLDPFLGEYFKETCNYMDWMTSYKTVKPLQKGNTFERLTFIYDLVSYLRMHKIPRKPALIKLIMPIIGEIIEENDESNLKKQIRKMEKRCQESEKFSKEIFKLKKG